MKQGRFRFWGRKPKRAPEKPFELPPAVGVTRDPTHEECVALELLKLKNYYDEN